MITTTMPEFWLKQYPDSTPPNLEKWRIPNCIPYNRKYGKLENDFLTKVGLGLDPPSRQAEGAAARQQAARRAAAPG
jgi:hypothetical protein